MEVEKTNKPMYEQIYDELCERIANQHYREGDRVPSEKELADLYHVSRITSKKALELLANDGLIVRLPGKGSFVKEAVDVEKQVKIKKATEKNSKRLLIGLVMTDFDYSFGTHIVHGVEEASRQHECFPVIRRTMGMIENEVNAIKELLHLGVDGLIVFPAQGEYFNEEILKLVINKFPLVLIDRYFKGIAATSISTDNVSSTKKAINYLFELGHEHISLISPPPVDTTAIEERIEGFIEAHDEAGIAVDKALWATDLTSTLPNAFTQENISEDIKKIKTHLQSQPQITALFVVEYNLALIAKKAIEELGWNIPEDISIISFDSPEFPLQDGYLFTHLKQQEKEIGRKAIENILKMKDHSSVSSKQLLDAELIVGKSTTYVKK
ncbi:GntR family transcriptional regulator [Lederbergia sp. NSJ-179]|uniref:GntR family transcriptional regulator n=1 Tax=Lederbergia sp. NSJ-179 TaxID=2931402 RepID=UPI001FD44508|nr:GntR family transcriptional regulator [Lederbergia sp. NSJ-179]MCJ7842466.1 GntR family transcriptional regulator [Lederbergia sp. NSJ-179]